MAGRVVAVSVGAPAALEGALSAFVKAPVAGAVEIGRLGLFGDTQVNRRVHGGPDKAVYVYPAEHYAIWRERLPQFAAYFAPGGLAENLTVAGLDEAQVLVDDVFAVGGAELQATMPRIPCGTIARRFGSPEVGRLMRDANLRGFYCRVLRPGPVAAGDAIRLLRRGDAARPIMQQMVGRGAV